MTLSANRRDVLKGAGALAIGFDLFAATDVLAADAPGQKLPGDLATSPKISSWLRVEEGGKIRLLVGKVELGQGVLTAVAQLCAEELDVDLSRVVITSGDTRLVPDEGVTAGSFSMPNCGSAVRQVAAEARQILLVLAAQKLGADATKLVVADGVVKAPDGKTAPYWDLVAGAEFDIDATGKTPLKAKDARRYVGKSIPRLDIPFKSTGANIFVQDYRPEGMLHGRVLRPPAYDAKLVSLDTSTVEKTAGIVKVVRDGSFIGVIADREEAAIDAIAELRAMAKWDVPTNGETQDTVHDWLVRQPTKDIPIKNDPAKGDAKPAATIEATYKRPYHMHASIGPSTAVAMLDADGVTHIQTHSQSVFETGAAIAEMLGVEKSKVHCQHMQGSGCYGHNGADDAAADAALLAQAVPGRPVRIQWSRNDEHKWEPYGSAMLIKTKATVDDKGDVIDWTLDLWSTSHGTRPGAKAGNLLAAHYLEKHFALPTPVNGGPPNYAADRNAIAIYEFPGQKTTTHFITSFAARASSTRGLGAYANVFSIESFMDELAARAGVDPVEYRLRYLKDERGRAILQKAADMFGWKDFKKAPGRGRAVGFARYKGLAAYCAVAMEVEVDRGSGKVRVLRVSAANDAGEVVSPDGVKNQIEGGIVQSLSWSLKEAVRFGPAGVRSADWTSYPILTFSEVPPIDVELIDRPGTPMLGTGEASQGPTGAALANAIFDATGARLRDIPFTPARVKAALQA
jgi:nicotinate dehydrogenase subunit B